MIDVNESLIKKFEDNNLGQQNIDLSPGTATTAMTLAQQILEVFNQEYEVNGESSDWNPIIDSQELSDPNVNN